MLNSFQGWQFVDGFDHVKLLQNYRQHVAHCFAHRQIHVYIHYVICQYTDESTLNKSSATLNLPSFLVGKAGSMHFTFITCSRCIIVNRSRARTPHGLQLEPSIL